MNDIQKKIELQSEQASHISDKLEWKKPEIHTEAIAITNNAFNSGADLASSSVI